jgi:hypothetical protein
MCNSNIITTNYIYLLQEREFIKTNENIYKIGMTTKEIIKDSIHIPKVLCYYFK